LKEKKLPLFFWGELEGGKKVARFSCRGGKEKAEVTRRPKKKNHELPKSSRKTFRREKGRGEGPERLYSSGIRQYRGKKVKGARSVADCRRDESVHLHCEKKKKRWVVV